MSFIKLFRHDSSSGCSISDPKSVDYRTLGEQALQGNTYPDHEGFKGNQGGK